MALQNDTGDKHSRIDLWCWFEDCPHIHVTVRIQILLESAAHSLKCAGTHYLIIGSSDPARAVDSSRGNSVQREMRPRLRAVLQKSCIEACLVAC